MALRWDPLQYLRFAGERERPFVELLSRVRMDRPCTIVDLGCGPGTTTCLLAARWPHAHITGVDTSPEMVEHAADLAVPGFLDFQVADLRAWRPAAPVDLIVANAVLHWVPDHLELLGGLVAALAPGGEFAFQVPNNAGQPRVELLYELATSDRWRDRTGALVPSMTAFSAATYLGALRDLGATVDAWETTYLHVLAGPDAVLEWTRGTALRPFLDALDERDAEEFLAAYAAGLRRAYPADAQDRVVLPFHRIFAVAAVPA